MTPSTRAAAPAVPPEPGARHSADGHRADAERRAALRRRFRIALAVLPVVLLAAAEVALRVAGLPRESDAQRAAAGRVLDLTDPRLFVSDPELLWVFRPNARIDIGTLGFPPFSTNADGLRGPPVPREHAPGELRVLCLGDSITFGLGLRDEQTLPARLEWHLGRDPRVAGRRTVRVVNAGVPGYSSVQGLRLLQRLADIRPDVVIWCFGMNDAKDSLGAPDAELRLPAGGSGGVSIAVADLRLVRLVRGLVSREGSSPETASDASRVPPDDFARTVSDAAAVARSIGAQWVVVETPEQLGVTASQLGAVVAGARAAGADEVRGSLALLSQWGPTTAASDLVQRAEGTPDGRTRVVFGTDDARADQTATLSAIEARLAFVRVWERRVTALDDRLPADRVRRTSLFGAVPGAEVYDDNCHLTERGADLAAQTLAKVCAARLGD